MQRRKARDDPMDRLELGHSYNLSNSIPMKKLSKMKVVKYLILIVCGILIHTTYRLLWKTDDNHKQEIPSAKGYADKSVSELDPFGSRSNKDIKHRENVFEMNKNSIKEEEKEQDIDSVKLDKKRRYEFFKKSIEKAKMEINEKELKEDQINDKDVKVEETVNFAEKQEVKNFAELDKLESIESNPIEALDLEKEHNIERKIAEVLEEVKISAEKEKTQPIDKAAIRREEMLLKQPDSISNNNPAPLPTPNPAFIQKADKIIDQIKDVKYGNIEHEHDDPEFVTAATSETFDQVKQLVFSLQKFHPNRMIYIFDLNLNEKQRRHLKAACNVRLREFWSNLFPDFISKWDHYHWRPLIIQTAMAEFGHIVWFNPGFNVIASVLTDIIKETPPLSIRIIGVNQQYTTYAVTHRQMYKYMPTQKKKLYSSPHIEIQAMILHNTPDILNNFMKLVVACAMEPKCSAPQGSKWQCDFDFSGKEYADCHRYDESAMNIALKNWFNFDLSKVLKTSFHFREYTPDEKMPLKMCRDENDMRA